MQPTRRGSRGLSLVEILVGLVIGLIGIVVIFQVLAVSESRKRTTVQGSDAQSSGAIALYSLQRDVQLAGYGFGGAETTQLGCQVQASDKGDTAAVPALPPRTNFTFRLYPVEIIQGAGGAPDTIRVLWGNSAEIVVKRDWTPGTGSQMMTITGGRGGAYYGDLLVLTSNPAAAPPPAPAVVPLGEKKTECALVQVTDRPCGLNEIGHKSVDYTFNTAPPCGPEAKPPSATPLPRFNKDVTWPATVFTATSGIAFNLGKQPRLTTWQVTPPTAPNPNRLIVSESLLGVPAAEAADGIINLQAEYGIDQNNDGNVQGDEWTVTPPDNTTLPGDPTLPCAEKPSRSWRCVRAVRVALLARSTHWDRTVCSPNPQWTSGVSGALTLTNFAMANVDGTADTWAAPDCSDDDPPSPNNWRRYRYNVYETVIPLRNMIWGSAP
jgi:type IV pilus assembly protein PilW